MFLVAATALGPGLIANTVLKDNWGRARPYQTDSFGGTRQFTPAPLPAAQCERNCAFVSGHAALAFSLVSFALLLPAGTAPAARDRRRARVRHAGRDRADRRRGAFSVGRRLCRADRRRDELAALRGDRRTRPARQPGGAARLSGRRNGCRSGAPGRRRAVLVAAGARGGVDRRGGARRDVGDLVDRPPARPVPALVIPNGSRPPRRSSVSVSGRRIWSRSALALCRAALGRSAAAAAALGRQDAARPRSSRPFCWSRSPPRGSRSICSRSCSAAPARSCSSPTARIDFGWLGLAADYWSFPSGHTAAVAALATALWCLWPRHVLFYIALASVVAASRVVTGAHYLSDVVAGGICRGAGHARRRGSASSNSA